MGCEVKKAFTFKGCDSKDFPRIKEFTLTFDLKSMMCLMDGVEYGKIIYYNDKIVRISTISIIEDLDGRILVLNK